MATVYVVFGFSKDLPVSYGLVHFKPVLTQRIYNFIDGFDQIAVKIDQDVSSNDEQEDVMAVVV